VFEEVNRKLSARNTTVQRLTLFTERERNNAQRYRKTADINIWCHCNSRSCCLTVDWLIKITVGLTLHHIMRSVITSCYMARLCIICCLSDTLLNVLQLPTDNTINDCLDVGGSLVSRPM